MFLSQWVGLSLMPAAEPIFSRQPAPQKARVVIVHDAEATRFFVAQPERIPALVQRGLLHLTGKTNERLAWKDLVSTNDTIGIKVYAAPGANSGTRPAVVSAVVESLLNAGFSPKKIIVWDKNLTDLRLAGFFDLAERFKIRVAASATAGYDEKSFYESALLGNLVWGDLEFGKKGENIGRKSFVSKLVTREITKIINVTPLLNHNFAAVTGNLFSLALGSVDNTIRFEAPSERLATAVPEIYAMPELSDRVALNITDALICQYQGEQRSLLHYSAPLNELWFSKDAVALDVLAIKELDHQRRLAQIPSLKIGQELYHNASLLELGVSDLRNILVEKVP
ncbi:MAG: DUF362 domain-containing protein [Verrucomicrobiota bacterium]|nr:DUF362 domain-containing protein [Verrucomicrobiota bacterium]